MMLPRYRNLQPFIPVRTTLCISLSHLLRLTLKRTQSFNQPQTVILTISLKPQTKCGHASARHVGTESSDEAGRFFLEGST